MTKHIVPEIGCSMREEMMYFKTNKMISANSDHMSVSNVNSWLILQYTRGGDTLKQRNLASVCSWTHKDYKTHCSWNLQWNILTCMLHISAITSDPTQSCPPSRGLKTRSYFFMMTRYSPVHWHITLVVGCQILDNQYIHRPGAHPCSLTMDTHV